MQKRKTGLHRPLKKRTNNVSISPKLRGRSVDTAGISLGRNNKVSVKKEKARYTVPKIWLIFIDKEEEVPCKEISQ